VYDVEIERSAGAAEVWLTTSAEQCGHPRAAVFASESFCQRAIVWNGPAARFDYAPLSTVHAIE
jgi:hypothetical protein